MDRITAEKVITEYLKKIYGFSLLKTANLQDAEDLTQDIVLKIFLALQKSEIENVSAFIWRVAKNTLANYYRGKSKSGVGVCIEDLTDILASEDDLDKDIEETETIKRLQSEIAYLSKMQRKIIIMYYYENKKQDEISDILSIPLGTVKWHLFEAKKEMKKGMQTMRESSELKFNPIEFSMIGFSGSAGTMGGTANFFRSTLSQNIAYCVYREAKTINEIADCLGVSPVYIESEVGFLEEYGFLIRKGSKYLANIIIDELDEEILKLQIEMYTKATNLIANDLYDDLINSELLNSDDIFYPNNDKNFLMWSIIPYLLAWCNEGFKEEIKFEDAITLRSDGGKNIANASIKNELNCKQKYFESMDKWIGPCWNGNENILLWQIHSKWSERDINIDYYSQNISKDLNMLYRFVANKEVSSDEYLHMAQKGYIKRNEDKFELAIVWLKNDNIRNKLLDICATVKRKHLTTLNELKVKFTELILAKTPEQMKLAQKCCLQYIFYSDGWFLLYTVETLLANGKLKLPTEEQRKSLTTIIMPNE